MTKYHIFCRKCKFEAAHYPNHPDQIRLVDEEERRQIYSSRNVHGFCDVCGWELEEVRYGESK